MPDGPGGVCKTELQKILNAENVLRALPQTELPVLHQWADRMYSRTITIPTETIMTGRIHKQNDFNVVIYGDMEVMTEHGMKRVKGGDTFTGKAGVKQIGVSYEETKWVTIHAIPAELEGDLDAVEDYLFEDEGFPLLHDFKTGTVNPEVSDYFQMLEDVGYSHEQARFESNYLDDRTNINLEPLGLLVGASNIEGLGMFATKGFNDGDLLGPMTFEGNRTQLGRYTNHSGNPNALVELAEDGTLVMVANTPIKAGDEITIDYRQSFRLSRLECL